MTHANEPKKRRFIIGRFLNFPANIISRFAWRFGKVDRYEVDGQTIVLRKRSSKERMIHATDVTGWSVHSEMGFDVVRIELKGGESVIWTDKYNDLLSGLRKLAGTKERSGE
jgi:hypothetical protein